MSEHSHRPDEIKGEPFFTLLARDELAPGMVALYAALRGRKLHAVKDIVRNLVVTARKTPMHPTEDSAHSISAQQVANQMSLWYIEHQPKGPTNARAVDLDDEATAEGEM